MLAYDSFLTYFKLNSNTIGAFNSTYYATCTIGNVILWYLPDKIGRIRTIQVACVINVAAIVLQAAAQNYAMFLVGRAIGGLCSGMICTVSSRVILVWQSLHSLWCLISALFLSSPLRCRWSKHN